MAEASLPDLLLECLPLAVELAEPGGVAVGILVVLCQQQQRRDGRLAQTAGRVDARREREADGRGRDGAALGAALVQHARMPGRGAGVDLRQSLRHKVAVLAREGHDVRHRADGDQVTVIAQDPVTVALERAQELIGHTHTQARCSG